MQLIDLKKRKMEKEAERELRKELQRVRILMEEEVGDDVEVGIAENAMQILQALKELKLHQNDQGFRVLKDLGIPEPPPEFVCPISGMLMKDPVIVDSGQVAWILSLSLSLSEDDLAAYEFDNSVVTGNVADI